MSTANPNSPPHPVEPRKRVFSGIQPTGHAHLGNYLGVFRRWAAMVAEPEELWARLRTAVTDPARVRRDDPGNPHVCNVFALHEFFTDPAEREARGRSCSPATPASRTASCTARCRTRPHSLRHRPPRRSHPPGPGRRPRHPSRPRLTRR